MGIIVIHSQMRELWLRVENWLFHGCVHSWQKGFPDGSAVKSQPASRGPGFDPWVRKIPWRRKCQSTPVCWPGKSHGQRNLVGYSPWDRRRVGRDLATKYTQTHKLATHTFDRKQSQESRLSSPAPCLSWCIAGWKVCLPDLHKPQVSEENPRKVIAKDR